MHAHQKTTRNLTYPPSHPLLPTRKMSLPGERTAPAPVPVHSSRLAQRPSALHLRSSSSKLQHHPRPPREPARPLFRRVLSDFLAQLHLFGDHHITAPPLFELRDSCAPVAQHPRLLPRPESLSCSRRRPQTDGYPQLASRHQAARVA